MVRVRAWVRPHSVEPRHQSQTETPGAGQRRVAVLPQSDLQLLHSQRHLKQQQCAELCAKKQYVSLFKIIMDKLNQI